jgi:DNA-binding response OmpR family regulator
MNKKVLIIEDDKLLREMMSRKLEKEGLDVFSVMDGSVAVSKAKEIKPDIVLLDLILPGSNGFEILKELQNSEETKETPVIVLSNLGQKSEIDKGMELGAIDYLVKAHFTPGEVLKKINKILSI